ncbi:MAG: outer membrane lipoprotein chaperone LolA [Ignavibacteriae bacterium]|nr:outer membrane lipoprotein chaperone LolA [Ignavibacteriota bacterium]
MRRSILIYCAFVCFSLPFLFADEDAERIISKLQNKYDSIRDASVTFTQDVVFGVTKAEQTFTGSLLMKKGNKYRIEFEEQTIVTDGKSVWSYTKANNQVLIDRYKENPNTFSPDKVLVNVPKNYTATVLGKESIQKRETTILKLLPRHDKVNLKWMKVWVDKDWLMRKIQVLDLGDNLTTYHIEAIQLNVGLAETHFQFLPPPDVEIIDLR